MGGKTELSNAEITKLDVLGGTSLQSKLEVKEQVTLHSTLYVDDTVTIDADAVITGGLTVQGPTNFNVTGTTTLTDASVDEFTIKEAATLKSALDVVEILL